MSRLGVPKEWVVEASLLAPDDFRCTTSLFLWEYLALSLSQVGRGADYSFDYSLDETGKAARFKSTKNAPARGTVDSLDQCNLTDDYSPGESATGKSTEVALSRRVDYTLGDSEKTSGIDSCTSEASDPHPIRPSDPVAKTSLKGGKAAAFNWRPPNLAPDGEWHRKRVANLRTALSSYDAPTGKMFEEGMQMLKRHRANYDSP